MKKYQFGGPGINLAFLRQQNGAGRMLRDRLYGNPGKQQLLARIAMTHAGGGTTTQPITTPAQTVTIQLDFHAGEWDAAYTGTALDAMAASLGGTKANYQAIQIIERSTDGVNWQLDSWAGFMAGARGVKDGQPPKWTNFAANGVQYRATIYVARDMNVGVDGEGT